MRNTLVLIAVLAAGCSPSASDVKDAASNDMVWLEGFRYEWLFFNHRISHLEFSVEDGGRVGIVGGTSTTGVQPDLDDSCDAPTCKEFPFIDKADVALRWGSVTGADAQFAVGTAHLEVGAAGETTTLKVTLEDADTSALTAVIRGLRINTDHPLDGGDTCYDPSFGWLPTHLGVSLGDVSVSGSELSVPVTAVFAAGNTLEAERACLDAVTDRARLNFDVEVLFIAGGGATAEQTISSEAVFEYGDGPANPTEQVPPQGTPADLGLNDAVLGWRALDWRFHIDDPEGRGSYLRTLDFDVGEGAARGVATNYSKGTQTSGFDYAFEGVIAGHEVGGSIERGETIAQLDVELDDNGEAVVYDLP
ncbi:MAG: hypothetical protein GWP91_12305, partial [Rhodobacterales bacterium]|nr:hypothetical protein [Rhodobacterales bacterium]